MLATLAPLAIILIALILMFKRVDVRLSLGISAAALFLIAGKLPQFFVFITQQMTNEKTVVPICTAMGFAYVLRITENPVWATPAKFGQICNNTAVIRVFCFACRRLSELGINSSQP